jgi:hypothetical protein
MSLLWPQAYLIGAPKAGTTSLHTFFRRHQSFFAPEEKYLRYFARELHPTFCWGLDEIEHRQLYLNAFAPVNSGQIAVDCDNSTILNPYAAERLAKVRPDAKIIAVLREPIERAWSHYFSDHERGADFREPEQALLGPPQAFPGMEVPEQYIDAGKYYQLLLPFKRQFSSENILLIDYDWLREDAPRVQALICHFCGVSDDLTVNLNEIHDNVTLPARNRFARAALRLRFAPMVKPIRRLLWKLPVSARRRFKKLAFDGKAPGSIPIELKQKLIPLFAKDVELLESRFGFCARRWRTRWDGE